MAQDQRAGFWSLFADINKTRGTKPNDPQKDGLLVSYDELELDISDEDLIQLKTEYEGSWFGSLPNQRINAEGDKNESYWKGKKTDNLYGNMGSAGIDKTPYSENIVFEAVETFLPLSTQKNPDPLVKTDNTPEMQELASKITSAIVYIADINSLKLKAQETTRNWLNRYVGIIKLGFDNGEKEIRYKVIQPTALILDPDSYVEAGCYYGEFLGEKLKDKARNLVIKFPKKKKEIEMICNGKMGSILQYTEWWTPDYVFFTMGNIVLNKARHPHWNYDAETESVDEFGNPIQKIIAGKNHFNTRKYPYAFLTVFSLQKSPVDEVSLIEQGRVLQDLINERGKQLTKSIRGNNGGLAVSGQFFNKEQANYVSDARREGRTIVVPTGKIGDAIMQLETPPLPDYVYQSMLDYRQRFLDIFGVRGSTPQGIQGDDTVRGKIIAGNQDTSRIGGGVTNHIEAMISFVYNYTLQLMYVYYDIPHIASVVGPNGAQEYTTLQASEFPLDRKVFIEVQPGSLIPKSPLIQRNEAMDLWSAGATDPVSLYKDLKDPNPEERAKMLLLWKTAPQMLFGDQGQTTPQTPNNGSAVGGQPIGNTSINGQPPPGAPIEDPLKQVPIT